MKVSTRSTLPVSLDDTRATLADVDSVLAAMPGAVLVRDGNTVAGSLKCKLGSTQITYRLTASAVPSAEDPDTVVLAVSGKEARGGGTLSARLSLSTSANGVSTDVEVSGDIESTGRGETAAMAAWAHVIDSLVAALPVPEGEPTEPTEPADPSEAVEPTAAVEPAVPAQPAAPQMEPAVETPVVAAPGPMLAGRPLYVAPGPVSRPGLTAGQKTIAAGVFGGLVLLLLRRVRRRRRPAAK